MSFRNSFGLATQIVNRFSDVGLPIDETLNENISLAKTQFYSGHSYLDTDVITEFSQAILDKNLDASFNHGRAWQRTIPGIYIETDLLNAPLFSDERFVQLLLERVLENPKRRILKSLIYIYFNFFPYHKTSNAETQRPNFNLLCQAIKELLKLVKDDAIEIYRRAADSYDLFDENCELKKTADTLLKTKGSNLDAATISNELGATVDSPPNDFLKSLFENLCQQTANSAENSLSLSQALLKLHQSLWPSGASASNFRINRSLLKTTVQSFRDHRGAASPDQIEMLIQHVIQIFGDPRLKTGNDVWLDCLEEALEIKRYLSRQSLEDFFKIIQETAKDQHWNERQRFWQAYHDAELIDEVWVILGADAKSVASNFFNRDFSAATLSQAQPNHSVLLMRFRKSAYELTVAEWSHDGACSIWQNTDSNLPKLYESHYQAVELRQPKNHENWIAHQGETSHWQHKIATKLNQLGNIPISPEVRANHQTQQAKRQQPTYSRFRGRTR